MSDVEEFNGFARELSRAVPEVGQAIVDQGEQPLPDLELPTVWMSTAGAALGGVLGRLQPEQQRAALAVVERGMSAGSELLRTCVATGLLEALASQVSGGRLDGPTLAALLGPESRAYIDAWDAHTLGHSSLGPS